MSEYPVKEIKRLKALKVLNHKVNGLTQIQIEQEMNISPSAQRRLMTWAQKANLIAEAEDTILEKIVPAALSRVHKAIEEEGDTSTALEILKGAGIFKKTSEKFAGGGGPLHAGEESLEVYLRKVRRPNAYSVPPVATRPLAENDRYTIEDLGPSHEIPAQEAGEFADEIRKAEILASATLEREDEGYA